MTETDKFAKTFIYTPSRESFGKKRPFGSFRSSKTASERASRYVSTLPLHVAHVATTPSFASLAFSLTDLRYRTGKCGLSSTNQCQVPAALERTRAATQACRSTQRSASRPKRVHSWQV